MQLIAANWGHYNAAGGDCTGQFHFGLFQEDGDLGARIIQRNGQWTEVREGESRPFPLGVWQHVALVVGGSAAHLYHNGLEVASQPVAGILPQPRVASLGIGCKTNSAGTDVELGKPCFWLGRIDELALFNRALSVAEIQRLSAAVAIASGGQTEVESNEERGAAISKHVLRVAAARSAAECRDIDCMPQGRQYDCRRNECVDESCPLLLFQVLVFSGE